MIFSNSKYFSVEKSKGISPFQNTLAYLGGSIFQVTLDNPLSAYRQLIQQHAKNSRGKIIDPLLANKEANKIFMNNPLKVSISGLKPRLFGVGFKSIPKFVFLIGISYILGEEDITLFSATGAVILASPLINPIRMIEKQQRAYFKQTGSQKSITSIVRECSTKKYLPLFRGTIPLMCHSLVSASTGLIGQPKLQKYITQELDITTNLSNFGSNIIASSMLSPIYVFLTNPLTRLEVIMQTSPINNRSIIFREAIGEVKKDSKQFGLRGIFRGQGIGIIKAIFSLTMFHQGRMYLTDKLKKYNQHSD
jgi:hypothetical protein